MASNESTQRFVDSGDGVRIAVYEEGNPDGPTVVLLHGWPDSHVLWDGVVPLLADRFRVIRYDNRGAGQSSVPKPVSAYSMARFSDDFAAVIDATAPGQPVHVLAHDWGSIGMWEYLRRPGASDRVASFTSVSGPAPTISPATSVAASRAPTGRRPSPRPRSGDRPRVHGLVLGAGARAAGRPDGPCPRLRRRLARRDGIPADQIHHSKTYKSDAANSVKIYPANIFRSAADIARDRYVDVPVQLIVNTRDPYLRWWGFDDMPRWVPRLWRRDIKAGHWAPMSHPQVLATAVNEFVDYLEGKPPSRALLRAQVGRQREHFGDTLVSVTGAGSGIGRETALAFAREGAELVVSDIDEASVKDTAAQIAARGGVAHAYTLDVADADAVERFADEICAEHGVPDIVVNNAGVGQAGRSWTPRPSSGTGCWTSTSAVSSTAAGPSPAGSVERGTGGHIVNVASMAAYAPLQSLNAYCTSKAAVYMFSDCLRAELDAAGIGLTTICPGLIDTNIVHTTRFDAPAGKRTRAAGRRKQLEKMFAARHYGPDKVAKAIVTAVKKNKPIRPVAPEAYLLYGTSRVAPQALRSTARGKVI